MIPVEYITEEELDKRFGTLSPKLREALASDRNLDIVKEICARNHIVDEEKVLMFQQIVSLIIMGFVHYYDAGQEINEALDLNNPKFSAAITDELTAKIFSPIKAELEGVYQPILAPDSSAVGPKILAESRPVPISALTAGSSIPQPSTPTPLSEKGWSTMQVSNISSKPQTAPLPFGEIPVKIPVGVPTPSMSSLPTPPQATIPAPMPTMIIRGDNVPKPIKNAPDFHSVKSVENIMPAGISAPVPLRPVVLEMSGMPTPIPGKTAVPMPPAPQAKPDVARVVHYGDLTSPLPTQFPVDKTPVAESDRQVTLMTIGSPIPQRPMPSAPKPMPTQNLIPAAMATKLPVAPMPTPKPSPIVAPTPITVQPAIPSVSVMPKPMMPSPVQAPPLPPRPMNPPIPASAVPKPIPEKIIVKDFTEGK